jgi:hypothetical protein
VSASSRSPALCQVLREDPELAESIPPSGRDRRPSDEWLLKGEAPGELLDVDGSENS